MKTNKTTLIQAISLSYDGNIVAIGSSGNASIYQYKISIMDWNLVGDDNIRVGNYPAVDQPLMNTVKVFYDTNVSVKKTVPITIQVQLGSGTSNVGVLLVCDSNIYLNVQLDYLIFSNQNLTKTVYINEREQCQLTVANKLTTISHRLFRIYNGVYVTKDENIIDQSSGGKFYYYSRKTITFSSSLFLKAISKAPITLVLVPIQNPIDEEQRFICTLLCGNNFSIEFIANTKNSSFINTLFLETGAHCKINVVYEKILW